MTLKRGEALEGGALSFLNVKDRLPDDLGRAFAAGSAAMPRARLGSGSWRFEEDALARLREKIAGGRKTLGEVYGAPLYGIKTGLNEAFVIDRATRDRLVAQDAKSADLLKPFLRGENVRRWAVESEDLFLINTPKGKVDIEAYPAVRDWLLPFRPELEKRATKQDWWELQQAQLAYQHRYDENKIIFQRFQDKPLFCYDKSMVYPNNALWTIVSDTIGLVGLLNSKLALWFYKSTTTPLSGGFYQLNAHQIIDFPLPALGDKLFEVVSTLSRSAYLAMSSCATISADVRHRILTDLAPSGRKLTGRLESWHDLDFAAFRAELTKAFRTDIALKQRKDWEVYLAEHGSTVRRLEAEIAAAEREIDAVVYRLFDLTQKEIALLETSLAGPV